MSIEAMKQALRALENYVDVVVSVNDPNDWRTVADGGKPAREAITSLRQAIAEAEKHEVSQKPVAVVSSVAQAGDKGVSVRWLGGFPQIGDRLYTSPPKHEPCPYVVSTREGTHHCSLSHREPLTDEELQQVMDAEEVNGNIAVAFARAIEAAHGIKGEA